MESKHTWILKTTGSVSTSSYPKTDFAAFQCAECGIAATSRLTNRQERKSAIIPEPEIDVPCDAE